LLDAPIHRGHRDRFAAFGSLALKELEDRHCSSVLRKQHTSTALEMTRVKHAGTLRTTGEDHLARRSQ
jgi:hypothetical protein